MIHEPFLKRVANTFLSEEEKFEHICFVFPNRRSCAFFKKYLMEGLKKVSILPDIIAISDFISEQSGLVEAGRVEQLFALYSEYAKLSKEFSEFDQFLYWGDMILSDFNDVDRYLIDAEELFSNVKNYKSINSNYLTKEQIEVINDFFGEYRSYSSDENLWREGDSKSKYLKLWAILYPLYVEFKKHLQDDGLSYSGMNYRIAAEKISAQSVADFAFEKIVFVGFSTLSKSEELIFSSFRNMGIGDYYWDYNSPVFRDKENKGTFFLRDYLLKYPSALDIKDEPIMDLPNIRIVSVPSGGGQAKVAGEIVSSLLETKQIENPDNAIDTAIVLPEEKYLNSVLYSIPASITTLNITMGYPMSNTTVASFIGILATMNGRKRIVDSEVSYFHEDLEAFLTHPYVKSICREAIEKLQKEIINKRLFFVPKKVVCACLPMLDRIFNKREPETPHEIIDYVESVLDYISSTIRMLNDSDSKIEQFYIRHCHDILMQIREIVSKYNFGGLKEKTFYFLMDRMLSGSSVAFEGEPLSGLQVMGVLETRLLDFKNIIIFSMNEKVFPSKHYTRSFIPSALRAGYGLSTYKNQDSMFTYYFYRMISRAENVYLLYDSRVQGISSGEVSRFIYQLRQLYNRGKNKEYILSYSITLPKEEVVSIAKTKRILDKIALYKVPGSKKFFSASMINTYLSCKLKFYFKCIEGIKEEDEIKDFIDSATFGTVVHGILQRIYDAVPTDATGKKMVYDSYLQSYLQKGSVKLSKIASAVINKEYNKREENHVDDLAGDAKIIKEIMLYYVRPLLEHDIALTPFEYVASEKMEEFSWNLEDGLCINYKHYIDRIDIVNGVMRIVDYKTGSDKTDIKKWDDIFENPNKTEPRMKAVMQLLLYCNAHAYANHYNAPIQPVIYNIRSVRTLKDGQHFCLTYGKQEVRNYLDNLNDGFMERIGDVVKEIFDPNVPFSQTDDKGECAYCPFIETCNRN